MIIYIMFLNVQRIPRAVKPAECIFDLHNHARISVYKTMIEELSKAKVVCFLYLPEFSLKICLYYSKYTRNKLFYLFHKSRRFAQALTVPEVC